MAIKLKAVERLVKFKKNEPGQYRGVMQAGQDAAGEVIKAWATEGHSVALPGLGTMRFGLRSEAVEKVEVSSLQRIKHLMRSYRLRHHSASCPYSVANHYACRNKSDKILANCLESDPISYNFATSSYI